MRLGTLLLRDAVIGLSQLEEALRAQILYGGRLGTNLVELGVIDLDTLGVYLAKVHGVPVATQARLEAADPGAVARLGRELAERHLAFPLGPEPLRPEIIAVALSEPHNPRHIEAIQQKLGATIASYAAAELRLLYYLEKHYGIERRPRFLRPAEAAPAAGSPAARVSPASLVASHGPPSRDRRRTRPDPGQVAPIVRFEPKKRAGTVDGEPPQRGPRLSLDDAVRAMDAAEHRDRIADAVLELAEGRLGAAALFIVRGKTAIGWRGLSAAGTHLVGAAIEKLMVPLGGSSVLEVALDTGGPHHGPSPAAGRPIERQIWEALGVISPPDDMLVVPISVAGRVVNLLYGHGPRGQGIAPDHLRELEEVTRHAGEAYLRIIQATRIDRLVR